MKKILILLIPIFLSIGYWVWAETPEQSLKKKGIHVAELSEADRINIFLNRLQQEIQQQNVESILNLLSPSYLEANPSFIKETLNDKLQLAFSNFSKNRNFPKQTNQKTGWAITSTSDFYLRALKIEAKKDSAWVKCEMGFSAAGSDQAMDLKRKEVVLKFLKSGRAWKLVESNLLFEFIEKASGDVENTQTFSQVFGASPIASYTEEDFTSTHSLVPTLLYIYNGTPIPRMNQTMSQQLWGDRNGFVQPYGIMADVQVTPGSPDFTYEYLWGTDAMANFVTATDQDEWMADYGEWGSGIGQFKGPYGISNFPGHYFVADMFNNRVITYYYEKGWDAPTWEATLTADFDWPIDVDAKDVPRTSPPEDVQYIAVADWQDHRIVFFHGWPYLLNFDRSYGRYGSGEGQFIYPTSVCFGRDPETGWQTNEVFVTDSGNDRLVWLYINPDTSVVIWRATYQFSPDVELTSVDVDNKGLLYVVDRRNGKVYKFAAREGIWEFQLLGIWGEQGTADGQLDHPNTIQVAHGRYCPYPDLCVPLTSLGDAFVTESWGDSTGIRRFVIASDVLNLSPTYVPYNEDTGEGNFISYTYHLTDFANVTEQVYRGGEVCTTYNRGALNYGSQGGNWNVDGHPHGQTYTVKITATSIYEPTIVVEKTVDVYVDTMTTHNPIITLGIRCKFLNDPNNWCDGCYQCIKEGYSYTVDVQAYDPHGDSLTYEWSCGKGYLIYEGYFYQRITIPENYICYQAPTSGKNGSESPKSFESFSSTKGQPDVIGVTVRNPYGGEKSTSVHITPRGDTTSCLCGDVTGNSIVDAGDMIFLLNYLFLGGPPPDPLETGDVNNDCGVVDGSDLTYLLNYLYCNGPSPECCWIY
jgi:hypothetical protein